ncbi:MAG: DNA polymerase III subunit gamma/tau [Rhodospirillaceae bacterium]
MDDKDAKGNRSPSPAGAEGYQVLARKYRPETFAGLMGQEALVRTLTNAIESDRLAQAYILTGVRGIGKTTTARIIARALNCIGPDGAGGPTPEPCGVCENCRAISQDRHVDVIEMDAASRTGVDDVREIIEGVRYRPTSARFKIYIIDEVHMLSKNAFNALLKTLEEPPPHVKFIFATTEIRKVPVTVLSRCQRFDLRRLDLAGLAAHFKSVSEKEAADITEGALHLIARAADGSVRDGLSLLDQAISMATGDGNGTIEEALVRDMLGLADRSQSFMLLEAVLGGDAEVALTLLDKMYQDGADPSAVLNDLLEIVHLLTRAKLAPAVLDAPGVPEIERVRGRDLAGRLGMSALARAWQVLLKGVGEVDRAPSAIHAAEMIMVRLAYASTLPTPEEAIRSIGDAPQGASRAAPSQVSRPAPAASPPATGGGREKSAPVAKPAEPSRPKARGAGGDAKTVASGGAAAGAMRQSAPEPDYDYDRDDDPGFDPDDNPEPAQAARPAADAGGPVMLSTFDAVADLAAERKEAILHSELVGQVHLVSFEPGRIEFRPAPGAPDDLAGRLGRFLADVTGERWMVTVSNEPGAATIAHKRARARSEEKAQVAAHPLVRAVMETFPGAEITEVRHPGDDED